MNANTSAAMLRYADLLEPVSADAPCGPDLEYDPAFVMLQAAAAPRAEAQYGDFVGVPPTANWAEIERDCRVLLLRTKDIRLAVILLRCRTRLDGAAGLRDGLAFLMAMLECHGEALHPLPVFEGERDPAMFANAIGGLVEPDGTLADARDIPMPRAAGLQLHVRDIEKSFAIPRQKDALAPESVVRLLKEGWGRRDATIAALVEAQCLTQRIAEWCEKTLGVDAPDLGPLSRALQPFARQQVDGGGACTPAATRAVNAQDNNNTVPGSASLAVATATLPPAQAPADVPADVPGTTAPSPTDRWSALAAIQETRMWFEQNEPSSPVIVLLRQSERMVGKRFSELAHIIPADLLAKWDDIDS
ncbi:type VI secretion system ImpA family N-terminal domain-containing protein (plasmid) [Paraburkholderia sprentiae WSM5005]|uniref:Type VI secretion system ImpA family N-terminal domain-containing protein n=1 Tax=Paraburkholderia sprentiae WSM5005 TaxID=754502 RepID=A0A1I9YV11_9BURK|nr:type VI secretion system ImpA family N-terminal domain-containing protein [Paraburkholderia sprentiae]APA90023.1 type VI secretion system ImpA family N-terminal domain-containing protein [Paraburkholderia sprentiae WSM5005]